MNKREEHSQIHRTDQMPWYCRTATSACHVRSLVCYSRRKPWLRKLASRVALHKTRKHAAQNEKKIKWFSKAWEGGRIQVEHKTPTRECCRLQWNVQKPKNTPQTSDMHVWPSHVHNIQHRCTCQLRPASHTRRATHRSVLRKAGSSK